MSGQRTERFALDRHGRLWPWRHRHFVKAVAIVTVRWHGDKDSADCASTAPAPAPAPAPEPAPVPSGVTKPVTLPARKPKLNIDLRSVPSGLEQRAESWKGKR